MLLCYSISVLVLLFLQSIYIARAQYLQDYFLQNNGQGFLPTVLYRATFNDPLRQVIDLHAGPSKINVILAYNRFYMKDICRNADNFFNTTRGQNMHPQSPGVLGPRTFGYDMSSNTRNEARGRRSCPSSWVTTHPCPEPDQQTVMRHDGPWHSTALEPNSLVANVILHDVQNGVRVDSNVRYTCDEFPPKSFVEGGNGIYGAVADRSQTRCAAMRCSAGQVFPVVKSEQNWQGTAHQNLRYEMEAIIGANPQLYPAFDPQNSIVLFDFGIINNPNDGVAARIFVYNDTDPTMTVPNPGRTISQVKKRAEQGKDSPILTARGITFDDMQNLVIAGHAKEITISAHMPGEDLGSMEADFSQVSPMEAMKVPSPWSADAKLESQYAKNWEESHPDNTPNVHSVKRSTVTPLLKRASPQDLKNARAIVQKALVESAKLNSIRLAQPIRNTYGAKRGAAKSPQAVKSATSDVIKPLLNITSEIADAAALVAEADSVASGRNLTRRGTGGGTYWMKDLVRKGTVPWGNDTTYKVFRNVLDFGAVGDGVTDDTKAITNAMISGKRCGEKCNGSTTKNAIVYFPPGNYLVSTTIALPFGTQVIGDVKLRPTLIASAKFIGLGVLSTDEYTGGAGGAEQYYINTANFYRQIRNIVIDITKAGPDIAALHYQVAQATSLQNVELIAKAGSTQVGMFAENGSGGQISDVTFTGGGTGLYGGNQQFTAQRLTFNGCTTGVQIIWDWGWIWKSVKMNNVKTAFKLVAENNSGNIGSVSILDSSFTNVGTVVVMAPPSSVVGSGSTGVVLENVALSGVTTAVADTAGKTLLAGSSSVIDHWVLGPVYQGSTTARSFSSGGKIGTYKRQATLLDSKGAYFERPKPQYEDKVVGDFVHVKDLGAVGDGVTDDTVAFQNALYSTLGKILFIDAGSYILTSTITIPPGAKIVGETWSQLVASGSFFEDASKPQVLVKVGRAEEVGSVEMQDLIFTTRGATAGLILIQWNIQAATLGSAALWDCHVRIGGATGTKLTPAECPPVTSGINKGCSAASLMMHLTSSGSGYFENMWLWGADHMLDDPDLVSPSNEMVQTSIYIARGFLIESTKATWLYGTASEHAVFYQYNFNAASNIFAGMLQTESPYFQPTPAPPAPFAAVVGLFPSDPSYKCVSTDQFNGCDESWAMIITKSENVFIAGAGIYSWFSTYTQTCIDVQTCQKALVLLNSNKASVRIQNFITIGAKYMAVMDGVGIAALDNLNVKTHPMWSQITVLDVKSSGRQYNDLIWIDPAVWNMATPKFTCIPPCNVKIPPWLGATSTVNYPLITVSSGTWTSTITQAPLTISAWVFEIVTLTREPVNKHRKRQGFSSFLPVLATTSVWPSVIYTGANGLTTLTAPTIPFPTPPATPLTGSFPKRFWQPEIGLTNEPTVVDCEYAFDPLCVSNPYLVGNNGSTVAPGYPDVNDENWEENMVICPAVKTTTTVKTTAVATTTVPVEIPVASPFEQGNHEANTVKCYGDLFGGGGEKTEHARMESAARSFCNSLSSLTMQKKFRRETDYPFDYNGGVGSVTIKIVFEILFDKCEFVYNEATCLKYLSVPTDSCDCKGINNKHGGTVTNSCYFWRIDPNLSF